MKFIICTIFFALVHAKDPAASKKPDLKLQPETPKAESENSLNLDQYKNLELKKEKDPPKAACQSRGGTIYHAGTAAYDQCIKEQDQYPPAWSAPFISN